MGWLKIDSKSEEYFGDEPLDCCAEFLAELREVYGSERERLPSLGEILINIEKTINSNLADYTSDEVSSVAVSGKTKKSPAKPKAAIGDFLAIPIHRELFAFAQVYGLDKDVVVIGVLPCIENVIANVATLIELEPIDQLSVEPTGVMWNHWQVIANHDVPKIEIKKSLSSSPCFVGELEIVELLQKHKVIESTFRLYRDVRAMHPKQQPKFLGRLQTMMEFLDEKGVLSKRGKLELTDGGLPDDFCMHSELLNKKGLTFFNKVFEKDYMSDYFYTDTVEKLEALWQGN